MIYRLTRANASQLLLARANCLMLLLRTCNRHPDWLPSRSISCSTQRTVTRVPLFHVPQTLYLSVLFERSRTRLFLLSTPQMLHVSWHFSSFFMTSILQKVCNSLTILVGQKGPWKENKFKRQEGEVSGCIPLWENMRQDFFVSHCRLQIEFWSMDDCGWMHRWSKFKVNGSNNRQYPQVATINM